MFFVRRSGNHYCFLQQDQITLNARGETLLCCVVFDAGEYGLGSFLDRPLTEIQEIRTKSPTCTGCMDQGLHGYFTQHGPAIDRLALKQVFRQGNSAVQMRNKLQAAKLLAKSVAKSFLKKLGRP